jgi:hypothetical protein
MDSAGHIGDHGNWLETGKVSLIRDVFAFAQACCTKVTDSLEYTAELPCRWDVGDFSFTISEALIASNTPKTGLQPQS